MPADYPMYKCLSPNSNPLLVQLMIHDTSVCMEVDTGATLSIMSQNTFNSTWPNQSAPTIQPTSTQLRMYTGEQIKVIGAVDVDVQYQTQKAWFDLVIVEGDGPTLTGHNWLHRFRLDWAQLHKVDTAHSTQLDEMLARASNLFRPGLGKLEGMEAKLYLKPNAQPKFCRARQVPFAILEKVEKEIDHQVDEGIIEPTQFSE